MTANVNGEAMILGPPDGPALAIPRTPTTCSRSPTAARKPAPTTVQRVPPPTASLPAIDFLRTTARNQSPPLTLICRNSPLTRETRHTTLKGHYEQVEDALAA